MNAYHRNGMIAGAVIGLWAAFMNWEGNIVQSCATVAGGVMFGYLVGHFIHRNGG